MFLCGDKKKNIVKFTRYRVENSPEIYTTRYIPGEIK